MSDVRPALTAEEWEHKEFAVGDSPRAEVPGHMLFGYVSQGGALHLGWDGEKMYAVKNTAPLAALALHGQPFGFTREMAAAIRSASTHLSHYALGDNILRELELCEQAADRIEALLPPEHARDHHPPKPPG